MHLNSKCLTGIINCIIINYPPKADIYCNKHEWITHRQVILNHKKRLINPKKVPTSTECCLWTNGSLLNVQFWLYRY